MDDGLDFVARDRCAISGIGRTEYTRDSGRSTLALATEAAKAATADGGLTVADLDAIVSCTDDTVKGATLAAALGMSRLTYCAEAGPGGVAPCMMIGLAIGAILSGQAKAVLAFRSLNGRSEARFGAGVPGSDAAYVGGRNTYDEFFLPYGLTTPGQHFALMAHRHMTEFGTQPEHLGAVSLACREAANQAPHAQMHAKRITMEDYLASRVIATPLRLFDFCLETDGAAAVIVTSAERAKDGAKRPVLISAVAGGLPPDLRPGVMFPVLTRDVTEIGGRQAGEILWKRAGFGAQDVDVAQLYDCFTISVILQLEAYGFCGRGEGGPFAASGAIRRGGSLPINTAGGHLSEGYIHGMNHIYEAVRQLRGEADMQIGGAETALCTGGPLPMGSSVALRRAA